jgi:hypothetical protein
LGSGSRRSKENNPSGVVADRAAYPQAFDIPFSVRLIAYLNCRQRFDVM